MRRIVGKSSSLGSASSRRAAFFTMGDDDRQLPLDDDKYRKSRARGNRPSTKCRLCICLCLVGICGGALIGVALLAVMGHEVAGKNEVVGKMQRRTKASIHHAYEKISKQLITPNATVKQSATSKNSRRNVKRLRKTSKGYTRIARRTRRQ